MDIEIDGFSKIAGGRYRDIVVNGGGKTVGDLSCESMEVNGFLKAGSKINTSYLKINGMGRFTDEVHGEKIAVDGTSSFIGGLTFSKFEVNGVAKIKGETQGDSFDVNGYVKIEESLNSRAVDCEGAIFIKENLQVEELDCRGLINVKGLLNGEKIYIAASKFSYIKEIGGSEIVIRYKDGVSEKLLNLIRGFINGGSNYDGLVTDFIEGDMIDISNIKVKEVRGNFIKIGEKCEIDKVEYKEKIEISPLATVKEIIKL